MSYENTLSSTTFLGEEIINLLNSIPQDLDTRKVKGLDQSLKKLSPEEMAKFHNLLLLYNIVEYSL